MPLSAFTLIDEHTPHDLTAEIDGDSVQVAPNDVASVLGWTLEERGLCRGSVCIPTTGAKGLVTANGIDLATLAKRLGRPLALDTEHRVAALAAAPGDRQRALMSLQAPDFTLPDLEGKPHTLSEHRRKKVLLIAYASW